MNVPSDAVPGFAVGSRARAPAARWGARTMYWSVRREIWENRSVYVAPLLVGAVALFGSLLHALLPPHPMPVSLYDAISGALIATAFIVGVFYCLDALHGERRDRSILFWKSLPVSDLTTVLSKASIPLVVLPLLVLATSVAAQLIMLLAETAALLGDGAAIAALWARIPMLERSLALLYTLVAIALWHAPIYGWLLLVSGWSRRAPLLWAVLPLFALFVVETIAFGTSRVAGQLQFRVVGWFTQAFAKQGQGGVPVHPLEELAPGKFLSTPDLWIGLALTAAFLVLAARLRRRRDPI